MKKKEELPFDEQVCDTFRKNLMPNVAKQLAWQDMPEDARLAYMSAMLETLSFIHQNGREIKHVIGALIVRTGKVAVWDESNTAGLIDRG